MSDAPLFHRNDIASAMAMLTRLPVRAGPPRGAHAAWAYPLVGALVGALAWLVAATGDVLALGSLLTAAIAVAALFLLTGGLHDDGLADTADGLWGGATRERRLEIMRDSRIGVYGVGALVLAMLLRWTALVEIAGGGGALPALVAAGAVSRSAMVAVWYALPPARADGLSAGSGRPSAATTLIAACVAIIIASAFSREAIVLTIILSAAAAAWIAWIAKARIGGQTGDILGAVQVATEIATLVVLAAFAP